LAVLQNEPGALADLERIGYPPYDYRELVQQRKWLSRLEKKDQSSWSNKQSDHLSHYLKRLLATPEYSLWDILKMGNDPYFSLKHLWNEALYQIDLREEIPQVEVQIFFMCGRRDYITPGSLIEAYYKNLSAPQGKHIYWFEQSGHLPEYTEPQKFYDIMVREVLSQSDNPGLE
jgi:pimeloyl-ACP methyl ester carboxylesterase